jgi:hypothetical protein
VRSLIVCLMLLLVRAPTLSAQYEDGPVRLAVPAGFVGPEVQTTSPGFKIAGFVRDIPGTQRGTVLQVTIIDLDEAGLSLPDPGQAHPTESLLDELLASVERRRNNFELVSRGRTELSGLPAARGEWRGIGGGRGMHGVMYGVIIGSRVVSLHTQTFDDASAEDLAAAVRAIESVVLQP